MSIFLALLGCGNEDFDDLRAFMAAAGKDSKTKMEPLPEVKPIESFEYVQGDLVDPFMPRNLRPTFGQGGLQPDLDRPRQPLEEFPLDALRIAGSITKPGQPVKAVVIDPKGTLHTVGVGTRIGQNFGVITRVTDGGLEIKELIQDSAGQWIESKAMMTLAD
jgi:type IV pilus assembly protein PilP